LPHDLLSFRRLLLQAQAPVKDVVKNYEAVKKAIAAKLDADDYDDGTAWFL
jgi:hypothetical protein